MEVCKRWKTSLNIYSDQIADDANLHPELRDETGHARKMNIPQDEVKALVAFP